MPRTKKAKKESKAQKEDGQRSITLKLAPGAYRRLQLAARIDGLKTPEEFIIFHATNDLRDIHERTQNIFEGERIFEKGEKV